MTRSIKFVDSFWGTDFCSTAGFDALSKRSKDCLQMCRDYERFIRDRAKAEETYAKSLMSLAKSADGKTETGTLRNSWDCLKEKTESIGQDHLDAARSMHEAADRVHKFTEKQKEMRKKEKDTVKRCSTTKKELHKKCSDARKSYWTKSKDFEILEHQVQSIKDSSSVSTIPTREWERLLLKQSKAQQEANKADQSYHQILDQLDQSRANWEREMSSLCNVFEELEEGRLHFLRNEMWVLSNICSTCFVECDESCEYVRKELERCDIDQDILDYINGHHTGRERPAAVRYEPYQNNLKDAFK